ncbi:hypothetical protein SISNIDRAFT_481693 [Sistotremastrum niveocremeum HHB9708]|uniref:MoaB/Mog domain-containing protein n=1 Tax=Sistotremastrum niveocremeum HHB9708 TaxID=1314777 RepID=A0A164ZK56_9AGAM|nr:hypothetical protein SISNIDRAFT_481693 [Sistotremastrum niveocremeum HHB9708]
MIQAAILTVSDTAAKDNSYDKSGPAIQELLVSSGKYDVVLTNILPDDEHMIHDVVQSWAQNATFPVDLIITTGGTGFGTRDRTPEAITPLIERPASGIVHFLLSSSISVTPLAALSRPVAGTHGKTLIITLPGSVKAVKENLTALLSANLLDHAIDLLRGGSGKTVHQALAHAGDTASKEPVQSSEPPTHIHHHHHHHHHDHQQPVPRTVLSHDPSLPATSRHRISPYPIIPLNEAIKTVLTRTPTLPVVSKKVDVSLRGHILAEDIIVGRAIPESFTTNVDGYAVRSSDPPGKYQVVTPQTHSLSSALPPGIIYRINTGASLPKGADAVIMVEDTLLSSALQDEYGNDIEEKVVETLAQVAPGENVRKPGSDVKVNELVLEKGTLIGSGGGEVGTLAFVGRREVQVFQKPRVALLSTGNELSDISAADAHEGVIYDTNRPSLKTLLEGLGYEVIDLGIAHDTIEEHVSSMSRGLEQADVLVTTGGSSMGSTDLLKPVIERHLGGSIHFGRVSVKPGKPTTFATVQHGETIKPIFGLPGNPASALVTFYLFVLPSIRKLGGWRDNACQLPSIPVQIADDMRLDPRPEFHRVIIRRTGDKLVAYSTGGQRSSRAASLSGANGLVALPSTKDSGRTSVSKGEILDAVVIGELQSL